MDYEVVTHDDVHDAVLQHVSQCVELYILHKQQAETIYPDKLTRLIGSSQSKGKRRKLVKIMTMSATIFKTAVAFKTIGSCFTLLL